MVTLLIVALIIVRVVSMSYLYKKKAYDVNK